MINLKEQQITSDRGIPANQPILNLQPKQVVKVLTIITALLVLVHLGLAVVKYMTGDRELYGLIPLFRLNAEMNIPSFFSGCLFLINAGLLMLVWQTHRALYRSEHIWLFLSALFVFLSFDDLFSVHERLIEPLRESMATSGLFYFAWIIVYGAGVAVLGLTFFPVWWRMDRTIKFWFGLSAGTFLSGTILLEMIGGAYYESRGGDIGYGMLTTLEESLEMAGLILFSYSLLIMIQKVFGGVSVTILDAETPEQPSEM